MFCFHDLFSNSQIQCWRHFDLPCQYLCKKILTETDITIADSLLHLCSRTEQLFALWSKLILLHPRLLWCSLTAALPQITRTDPSQFPPTICTCMDIYHQSVFKTMEPLHAFYLFSFERYNGLLGAQPNNRSIEMQLMKQFMDDNEHLELLSEVDHANVFYDAVAGEFYQ